MTGYVLLHRGWRDCDVFMDEPMSEREAWLWLIENAAWKPMMRSNAKGERIRIERGQMHVSLRAMEKVFGWGKNKVARFIQRLEDAEMVGTASGQSGTLITICNYSRYQDTRDSRDTETGTASGQLRDTQEEGIKNNTISEANASSIVRAPKAGPFPAPDGVPDQVWGDFLKSPKRKKAGMSPTAYAGITNGLKTLSEHGYPPGEMIELAVERGWTTVKLEWVQNDERSQKNCGTVARMGGPSPDPTLALVRAATAAQRQDAGDHWEARPALPARQFG